MNELGPVGPLVEGAGEGGSNAKATLPATENLAFYLHYLDFLVALSEAREERDRLAAALRRERTGLYIEYGVKGYTPLSELDALWDEWMLPILELAHLPMERPWAKAVRVYRAKQGKERSGSKKSRKASPGEVRGVAM